MSIKIEQSREDINSNAGILLLGQLLQLSGWRKIDALRPERIKEGVYSHSTLLKVIIVLLALGRCDFADIAQYSEDSLLKEILGLDKIPSQETLRQRLNDLGALNPSQEMLDNCVVELLGKVQDFGQIHTQFAEYTPLDIDVSVMLQSSCQSRDGVGWTYHQANGYAPIFAYLGTQGYMLANELRPGTQHSAKGAVEFVTRCLNMTKRIGLKKENLLLRLDSGHDDGDFIKALSDSGVKFLVKRNLRRESLESYQAMAKKMGAKVATRDGKNIYRCILSHRQPKGLENIPLFMVVEVSERSTDAKTQEVFLFPELEVSTWWTNMPEYEEACIRVYHDHATSEQFHSELKSDIGLENMPSGKFETNALVLNLATLTFNCLRWIGQESLQCKEAMPIETEVSRRRLRSVMQNFIYIACKFTRHAQSVILKFGCNCQWYKSFEYVYARC